MRVVYYEYISLLIRKLIGMKFWFLELNCVPGQGEYGASITEIRGLKIDSCQSHCKEFDGCSAIDFTNTDNYINNSSCRMYQKNIARSAPGTDNRIYCTNAKYGTKKLDM